MKTENITIRTSPSLALIKYWGKSDTGENIPATSSLAVTLEGLFTETKISVHSRDEVVINGSSAAIERYIPFFNRIRKVLDADIYFKAESHSNFPTAAGLASSSSGFAALALGCAKLIDPKTDQKVISELARLGSASASRAVYGGFTALRKDSTSAEQLFDKKHWPKLKIIVAIVAGKEKEVSSRAAMENARKTSPYYKQWLGESETIYQQAVKACYAKDLNALGPLIRKSYLMMFSTMFTSEPPLLYWEPSTIALIKTCEELRILGLPAWETMDAGPQVKIFTLDEYTPEILKTLKKKFPEIQFIISQVGDDPTIINGN